jgi:biopolymer transport protein ExbB
MKIRLCCLAMLLAWSSFSLAETLEEALAWSHQELETARKELSTYRDSVVEKKLPLSRELRVVRVALVEQREAKRLLDEQRENGDFEISRLKSRETSSKELATYFTNQAVRFRQSFEADLIVGERHQYAAQLLEMDRIYVEAASAIDQANAQWQLIEDSLARLAALPGGARFKTEAVSDEGILNGGSAVQFGPLVFFQSDDQKSFGNLAEDENLQAKLISLGNEHRDAVQDLFAGKQASLLVDPTLGQAALIEEEAISLRTHLARGGFWMIPICLFGICATVISLFKWMTLRGVQLPSIPEFETLRNAPGTDLDKRYRGDGKLLLSRLLAVKDMTPGIQSAELDVAFQEFKFKMNRWLPVVALTAGVSPLLGLLGTVTGMIKTFQLISLFGAGDAKLLSSGISEALITTEFGLIVAIPALIMHAYLQRRVKKILVRSANLMEQVNRGVNV